MSTLKVALAQLEVTLGRPETNLDRAQEMLAHAKEQGAHLVLLPELWPSGCDLERVHEHAAPLNDGIFAKTSRMAAQLGLYICGSALEARDGRHFNTLTIYAPDGELIGSYSKIHLFGLMHEPDFLAPGTNLKLVNLPWCKAGLAVCYDLRFPEMFRHYALAGAGLLLLSAEWPHPRLEHWRTLLRARAIENQSFVVACNCVGWGNGNSFFGHSTVIDPWGEVLIEADDNQRVVVAKLDLSRVADVRDRFPVFADRRTGLYSLP